MSSVIPPAFAFHFSIPVQRCDDVPSTRSRLSELSPEFGVLWPDGSLLGQARFTAPDLNHPPHIDLRIAWNPRGIAFQFELSGKTQRVHADFTQPTASDGLQVWIDTRNTQTIHRASRFCHHFCLLAVDGSEEAPTVIQLPLARAAEDAKVHPASAFRIDQQRHSHGYQLLAWLPAEVLTGFDVETCSHLGFNCLLVDRELGLVPFTIGLEFPISNDPSLWQTLELVG